MRKTNLHGTWGQKLRLVGENDDKSICWKEGEPRERSGQTNATKNCLCVIRLWLQWVSIMVASADIASTLDMFKHVQRSTVSW
ncbi:hypothetical protein TNCV_547371 [Trichonephila clavipes]|nr:hypothetical protein TNCV_547371 [Trichonephila clavipes]